jgi:hypothetical protein
MKQVLLLLFASLYLGSLFGQTLGLDNWQAIRTSGKTICSNGSPYSFFYYPQSTDKLLVYFEGGGACWNPENCDLEGKPTYTPTVDSLDNPGFIPQDLAMYRMKGIIDVQNPANPFLGYSVVVIPYCTADTHLGSRTVTYTKNGKTFKIRHQGFTNVEAALNWVYGKMKAPKTIFVCGCSAGSIPAPIYASMISKHYPEARVTELSDASGAYTDKAASTFYAQWGVKKIFKKAGLNPDASQVSQVQLMIASAKLSPKITFSTFNTAYDDGQEFFLGETGEDPTKIYDLIKGNMEKVRAATPNFYYFIAPGKVHTILDSTKFYDLTVNGVSLRQWVYQLAEGQRMGDVECSNCK